MTLEAGQKIYRERYTITERLGQGGMGAVYLAVDENFQDRYVAIKENLETSRNTQQQFQQEANTLAKLNHPNLPRVTNYFIDDDGRQYLVMDYIDGLDLQQILNRTNSTLDEAMVMGWLHQIMDALSYMHSWVDPKTGQQTPIIHRDIKPSNIKQASDGRIVLVDFGIAKVAADHKTMTSAKAQTPGFSPVEQYSGGGTDVRSDIYSLGATFYCLLTRITPPEAPNIAAQTVPFHSPRFYNGRISRHVERVIMQAMRTQPAERFQSINQMRKALHGRWSRLRLPFDRIAPSGSAGRKGQHSLADEQTVPDQVTEQFGFSPAPPVGKRQRPSSARVWGLRSAAILALVALGALGATLLRPGLLPQLPGLSQATPSTITETAEGVVGVTDSSTDTGSLTDTGSMTSTTKTGAASGSLAATPVDTAAAETVAIAANPVSSAAAISQTLTATATLEISVSEDISMPEDEETAAEAETRDSLRATSTPLPATATLTPSKTPVPPTEDPPTDASPTDASPIEEPTSRSSASVPQIEEPQITVPKITVPSTPTRTTLQRATSTRTPTRTPTPVPTDPPTRTPMPTDPPTRTPVPTDPPTRTPVPTDPPTRTPTPTRALATGTPTATATAVATSTPVPTLEPTLPPATPTLPAATPTAAQITSPNANGTVTLIGPLDSAIRGTVTFSWQTEIVLAEDEYFELIFWRPGEDPLVSGFSPVGAGKSTSELVRLDRMIGQLPQLASGRDYLWGVRLVKLDPFRPIAHLGAEHPFRLESEGGGGGGESAPDPTPRG